MRPLSKTDDAVCGKVINPGAEKYLEVRRGSIFFDKSMLLWSTNNVIETPQKYLCFSRPRRFGKTTAADMISAYYDRSVSGDEVFRGLEISADESFDKYRNRYDVVFLNMQDFLSSSSNVTELKNLIRDNIVDDLNKLYSNIDKGEQNILNAVMQEVFIQTQRKFVIVIDEWDCIFREWRGNTEAQKEYLDFLRLLLKDKAYIALVYMTGILPIKKYGSHSALNMFDEYSMENPRELAEFVGLTEKEVKQGCEYAGIDFEECKRWYDGYSFKHCSSVYNPRSVISLLRTGEFYDYWNKTESYEALRDYIDLNYDGVRDDVLALMAGERRYIDTGSFTNDMTTFANADDVMTLLVHLGYLGYDIETREVFIPNKEIMQEFVTTTVTTGWDEVVNSVKNSKELLRYTIEQNESEVSKYIEKAHLENSHLQYNDENALAYTISLAYYAARDYYHIRRELPSEKGFADMVFIPRDNSPYRQALVVELKWDKSAQTAINQIKDKQYTEALKKDYKEILLIGINYDKETKKHECKIERVVKL